MDKKRKKQLQKRRAARQRLDLRTGGIGRAEGEDRAPHPALKKLLDAPRTAEAPRSEPARDPWWKAFREADPQGKLQMIRARLPEAEADPDLLQRYFPDALDDLAQSCPGEVHAGLLEEIRRDYPRVFASDLGWNAWFLSYKYIADSRPELLLELIGQLAQEIGQRVPESLAVITLLRLAGYQEIAQRLIDAALTLAATGQVAPWAHGELRERAMFAPSERCVQAGLTAQSLEEAHQESLRLGGRDSSTIRELQAAFVRYKAGRGEPWEREALLAEDDRIGTRFYMLFADFSGWAARSRGIPPVAADELRLLLSQTCDGSVEQAREVLGRFEASLLDEWLRPHLELGNLNRVRAPATIAALYLLSDFLEHRGLIDQQTRQASQRVCREAWQNLRQWLGREWWKYRFLERYWPDHR